MQLTLEVSQGSVIGPLLFNIYINHFFPSLNNSEVCNYADDTTLFVCDDDIDSVVSRIELDWAHAVKLFCDNCMKLNEDMCYLLTFGDISKESVSVEIGSSTITNSVEKESRGVALDTKLTFEQYVGNLCQKICKKTLCATRYSTLYGPK